MSPPTLVPLELVVRATLILAALLLTTRLVRPGAPVLAAATQTVFLAGLAVLPVLALWGPPLRWHVLPSDVEVPRRETPAGTSPRDVAPLDAPGGVRQRPPLLDASARRATRSAQRPGPPRLGTSRSAVELPQDRPPLADTPPPPRPWRVRAISAWGLSGVVYAAVVAVLVVRIVIGLGQIRALLRAATRVEDPGWGAALSRWRAALGLGREVGLLASEAVTTPITVGWRRPVIVIPARLERGADATQRDAAIVHELAHVQRSDFAWHLLLRCVEAIYWFHPLQWLVSRSVAATRELVCDALCARHLGIDPYARALVSLAEQLGRPPLPAVGLAMARTSQLGRRISALRRFGPSDRSYPKRWQLVVIAGPLALLIAGTALVRPVAALAPPPGPAAGSPATQPAGSATARKETPGDGDQERVRLVARSGRVLDPNGQPVAGARVEMIARPEDRDVQNPTGPLRERAETDEEGRYTVHVPPQLDFGITISSDRGAVARLVVPAGGEIPADIQLERGATLRGRLLNREGRPARGCVVAIASDDDQTVQTELSIGWGLLEIKTFRVTDAEGRFEFPPLLGDFLVSLQRPEDVFPKDSDAYRGAAQPPPLGPVSIHLDAPGDRILTLVEAPTAAVRGTLRWHDGKPASGLRLEAMLMPRRGNRYLDLGTTKTDQDGRYTFRVPLPLDGLEVSIPSQRGLDRKRWEVRPVAPKSGVSHHRWHDLVIGHLDGDRDGLDLVIVPKEDAPVKLGADDDPGDADSQHVDPDLLALEREVLAARKAYADAEKSAKTEEDRDRLGTLDPRRVMVARCLEVESRHRGSRTGIGALRYVMRAAATTSSAPVDEALARAIALLGEHYVAHADLDLLLQDLTAGSPAIEAEALLRRIAAESPHAYVRAEALYDLAAVLGTQAEILEHDRANSQEMERSLAMLLPMQTSKSTRDFLLYGRDTMRKRLVAYRGRDLDAMRTEAERLFDQIVTHFPDVRAPDRHWAGPVDLRLVDAGSEETAVFRRWSVPERADAKLFQRSKLRLGLPAPILEGNDLYLRRIRLSDFLGKVVVLTVTMSTLDDMYDRCKGLLTEFAGRPAVCLSVVPSDGDGGYSVRAIVREMGITWPILRDPRGQPIAHRWCQETFPEAYVIDPQGRIRFHESGNESVSPALVQEVRRLLESAPRP